jgi:hypothetical protein
MARYFGIHPDCCREVRRQFPARRRAPVTATADQRPAADAPALSFVAQGGNPAAWPGDAARPSPRTARHAASARHGRHSSPAAPSARRGRAAVARRPLAFGRHLLPRAPASHLQRSAAGWLLLPIAALQTALSIRLVWRNTAFQDEALYLLAGRLEIAHWLHSTAIPAFPAYFSGAPVLYPPLAAVADSIGGLAGARILSLSFMLGTTALLWATTSRLYGHRAAFFAAALFAVLGPTLHLGAFATFDAMSLFLVALAAWSVVRAGQRRDETGWMLAAGASLALANVTAYSSVIFDPVVIVLAIGVACPKPGGKYAVIRGAALLAYVTTALVIGVTIGGGSYTAGIAATTLARAAGDSGPGSVLAAAGRWTGAVVILAGIGAALCLLRRRDGARGLLPAVLAAAALLAPLEQARIHTMTSLDKHADIGAWFAAIAAGYAVDRLIGALGPRPARGMASMACGLALIFPAQIGARQSESLFSWPNAAEFIAAIRPIVTGTRGPVLIESPSLAEFYLHMGSSWQRFSNTTSIITPSGRSINAPVGGQGAPGIYLRFIRQRYFSIIALTGPAASRLDRIVAAYLSRDRHYRVVAQPPYGGGRYVVWKKCATRGHRR